VKFLLKKQYFGKVYPSIPYFSKVYSNKTTFEKVYSNKTAHTELALQLVKKYHLKFKPVQQNRCMNPQEFQSLICQAINRGQYNKWVHNCELRCLQQKVTASDPECLVYCAQNVTQVNAEQTLRILSSVK
jgi:diphthamide biosynthesis methyltransferase